MPECLDCGVQFARKDKRGPAPTRCPDCNPKWRALQNKKSAKIRYAKKERYCPVCDRVAPTGKMYCDEVCREYGIRLKWGIRTCPQCEHEFLPTQKVQKFCSRECQHKSMQTIEECICQYCGEWFRPDRGDRTTYCCREHSFAAMTDGSKRGIEVIFVSVCPTCGKHADRAGSYCSDECIKISNNRKSYERSKRQFEGSVKHRKCKFCKVMFVPEYGSKNREFCSRICAKRHNRNRYGKSLNSRARGIIRKYYGSLLPIMYEPINAKKVLERDNWICGICGEPIDKQAKCPHPKSKSIDHIVALAKGGSHTYDNVQAAHFECNWRKGDQEHEEASALESVNEAVHCRV